MNANYTLSNYFRVDVMDHMIKNANVTYRSWKYWHGAMLHAKGMAIVVAYDMYLEVCEGKLNEDWANADPVSFHTFREQLSAQMLAYDPRKRLYPGDEFMRISTKQPSNVRLFLLINSIIIVNQSFGLLKIHGHAMFAAIPHIPNVEYATRLCT